MPQMVIGPFGPFLAFGQALGSFCPKTAATENFLAILLQARNGTWTSKQDVRRVFLFSF